MIDDKTKEKSLFSTINVERTTAENNIDFKTNPLSCSGSYVLIFDIVPMKKQNIETINIDLGIIEKTFAEKKNLLKLDSLYLEMRFQKEGFKNIK